MKSTLPGILSAAAALSLPAPAAAFGRSKANAEDALFQDKIDWVHRVLAQEEDHRELPAVTTLFSECQGKSLALCEALINAFVRANAPLFAGLVDAYGSTEIKFEVKQVRESQDEDYYNVGLRTNLAETHVVGILNDGMVFYPWKWCLPSGSPAWPDTQALVDSHCDAAELYQNNVCCIEVGPWDCDVGTPLTVEGCCNLIKDSVPAADVNGNYLDCHTDPPLGSDSNPEDPGRVIIHVNSEGKVVHPPKTG
eukprot:CAMPEP_0172525406 /NCGR_PEP_ID=MMETSP1067-20121228/420_1 /TAXON_ID=265564 ORGANISM="Thalassiosira punctigera, Strain Tpunct2005C2" /NCGR_SAMPLE_ID=MMETSP1067 /ASSEMBLY_ACC=CAM_ASM_000444 /LENGTH=251 /DNA_ID=CAMNT_0013308643 /DNA_START=31 /DNA_END=786 /DNA_ORIENTATION=-